MMESVFLYLSKLELPFLYGLQNLHTPWMDWIMVRLTFLGEAGWFWIALGICLCCIKKTRTMGITVLVSILIGFLIGNVWMKHLFERLRPCWMDPSVSMLVQIPKDFSFPSGHSLVSFEGAVSIFLGNKKWGRFALVLAVLIAFSRLYLFVHFPTDVLAGSLMGAGIAVGVHAVITGLLRKNTCKPI